MSKSEYRKLLMEHDWYYAMSDDPRIYDTGLATEKQLLDLAKSDPILNRMYYRHFNLLFKPNERKKD